MCFTTYVCVLVHISAEPHLSSGTPLRQNLWGEKSDAASSGKGNSLEPPLTRAHNDTEYDSVARRKMQYVKEKEKVGQGAWRWKDDLKRRDAPWRQSPERRVAERVAKMHAAILCSMHSGRMAAAEQQMCAHSAPQAVARE